MLTDFATLSGFHEGGDILLGPSGIPEIWRHAAQLRKLHRIERSRVADEKACNSSLDAQQT